MSAISLKTHKMLWGRSGNMCAFPDCKKFLVADETLTDDASIVGEEAHIIAQKNDGPRGTSGLTLDQRNKYDNLILLCNIHHKIVDDQVNEYTVQKLNEYKNYHENWVKTNLHLDSKKIKDDELYASYIEKFISLSSLETWSNWTWGILNNIDAFPKKNFDNLKILPNYIISRIWPKRYPKLEQALINFTNIVNDLFEVYSEYPEERQNSYGIEKFYRNYYRNNYRNEEDYSYEREKEAIKMYEYHIALLEDIILELTRAANYICDFIREFLFEGFRLEDGAIMVQCGDYKTFRVEYIDKERIQLPYPGLQKFMEIRITRDLNIGEGVKKNYYRKIHWEE